MTTGNKRSTGGFTLLELLVVMGIMALMMGIGITGYFGIRRGAEMRGGVSTVRTALMLGRQQAVTKRRTVIVNFLTNTNAAMGITNHFVRVTERAPDGSIMMSHADAYLPIGVKFEGLATVTFYPSGRASGLDPQSITVKEKSAYQKSSTPRSEVITVWPLTGVTKVVEGP